MKEFIKNNSKVISLLVIVILLGAIGLTFAYTMDSINIAIGTGEYNVVYTGTSSLPSANLTPILDSELTSSSNTSKVLKIDFTVKGAQTNPTDRDIIYDVSLTDLNLPTELQSELLKWRLYKNSTQISEGNFSREFDAQVDNRMVLTEIQQDLPSYSSSADSYIFYIWISETCTGDVTTCTEESDASELMNKIFSGNIRIELSTQGKRPLSRVPYVNKPDLAGNSLIPIYYDEACNANQGCWKKADENNINGNWYNYSEKKWANAVLVKENSYTEAVEQTNKTVSIANEPVTYNVYTSSNKGVNSSSSISIFTFTTGASGGTFSFDYSVSSESNYDKLTITLNGTTIISAISGTQSSTYTTTLSANTEYTLQATYAKDSTSASGDDQATISNIVLPSELTSPLTVTASGSYGWTTSTVSAYSLKIYTSYKINDSGNYVLETANGLSATEAIGKYICSDASSTECSEIYQIRGASGNTITSVDVYTTNYKEGVRTTYQNASAGTPITESDILAYYVWIPRYKYKVWNINKEVGTDTYDAYTKGIDIVFEVEDATTGTITCDSYSYAAPVATKGQPNETCSDIQNGEGYYTHPAFTFGNDKLSGFWIGKFELSSTDQTAENYGGKNRTDLTPRILPDVMSWRINKVDNFWKVIYDMQTSNNIYGLPTSRTTTDSHMSTNMEWGAVAYLTHSKYGRCTGGENSTCTEVAKNNSGEISYYTNYTGRSSGTGSSNGYTAEGTYTYKEEGGQLASTTGNIYGVYDMSGGAYEYVMGNIGTSAGQTSGEYKYYASSAGSNYAYAGFEKYLIPYAYGTTYTDQTAYNRGKLGDATSEVVRSTGGSGGWYGDYANFPRSSNSWFVRGGDFSYSAAAGPFYFDDINGNSGYNGSARASLASVSS